ncbi:MAG: hypothetical protein ACQEXJ_24455 [Myxococcota bacterium]
MRIRAITSAAAVATLALAACGDGSGAAPGATRVEAEAGAAFQATQPLEAGTLVTSADGVSLGEAPLGQWTTESIALHNPGPGDAPLERIAVDGPDGVQIQVLGHAARPGHPAVFTPPHRVRPGDVLRVDVVAQPATAGEWSATVSFEGGEEPVEVSLAGETTLDAITPVVRVVEGSQLSMPPIGSVDVHLSGVESASPDGEIVEYAWKVSSHDGGQATLLPNRFVAAPTLRVFEPGRFDVRLTVVDEAGHYSPISETVPVHVVDDSDIRVEVAWAARDGADLDVHLVHPAGQGKGQDVNQDGVGDGWFDADWDAWQDNPQPIWTTEQAGVLTTPVVATADARDVVVLSDALLEGDYRVGVHVVDGGDPDHPVRAQVTVRMGGEAVWSSDTMELREGDLWDVGAVSWQEGVVDRPAANDEERVVPSVAIP